LNAVAVLVPRADETPETLLAQLQRIEMVFGRQPRQVRNKPRPLDLDLLTFRREVRATATLTLPHPRAHLRRFVLEPLNEIAPDCILPRQTKSVRALLAELETDEVVYRII
jgi:2-amino-4-hydroxy-6-hydroxymethyldihydropteridine diphosphokinase